jgi:murein DD-endopeptidase MepM/ murein hydrolase activator NlpD
VAARHVQPGELVVMTITVPRTVERVRVHAFNSELMTFEAGRLEWRVLVGIDLGVRPGTYAVRIDAGNDHASYDLVVRPKVFPTRHLKVDEAFVTPPPSADERIRHEAELLDRTWRSSASQRLWGDRFVRPVPDPSNSAFGSHSVFNGQPRSAHGGADFLSPAGRSIQAPAAGRVVVAQDLYYSGNTVVIDHGLGLFSMLAHLSKIEVRAGDDVHTGQLVGSVGATGRVTGPHLHWAVRAAGARVDPLSLLALLGADLPTYSHAPRNRRSFSER